MTEDEQIYEAGMRRAAPGGWLLISFGGATVLVLALELMLLALMAVVVGGLLWADPAAPWNSTSAPPTPAGVWAVFGGMIGVFGVLQIGSLLFAGVVAFGGYNLLRLRSRSWAMTGAVACIISVFFVSGAQLCFSYVGIVFAALLFPLGIVAAVMALVAIVDPGVIAGFEAYGRITGRGE